MREEKHNPYNTHQFSTTETVSDYQPRFACNPTLEKASREVIMPNFCPMTVKVVLEPTGFTADTNQNLTTLEIMAYEPNDSPIHSATFPVYTLTDVQQRRRESAIVHVSKEEDVGFIYRVNPKSYTSFSSSTNVSSFGLLVSLIGPVAFDSYIGNAYFSYCQKNELPWVLESRLSHLEFVFVSETELADCVKQTASVSESLHRREIVKDLLRYLTPKQFFSVLLQLSQFLCAVLKTPPGDVVSQQNQVNLAAIRLLELIVYFNGGRSDSDDSSSCFAKIHCQDQQSDLSAALIHHEFSFELNTLSHNCWGLREALDKVGVCLAGLLTHPDLTTCMIDEALFWPMPTLFISLDKLNSPGINQLSVTMLIDAARRSFFETLQAQQGKVTVLEVPSGDEYCPSSSISPQAARFAHFSVRWPLMITDRISRIVAGTKWSSFEDDPTPLMEKFAPDENHLSSGDYCARLVKLSETVFLKIRDPKTFEEAMISPDRQNYNRADSSSFLQSIEDHKLSVSTITFCNDACHAHSKELSHVHKRVICVEKENVSVSRKCRKMTSQLREKDQDIVDLKKDLGHCENELARKNAELDEKDGELMSLRVVNDEVSEHALSSDKRVIGLTKSLEKSDNELIMARSLVGTVNLDLSDATSKQLENLSENLVESNSCVPRCAMPCCDTILTPALILSYGPCGHVFCQPCILEWFKVKTLENASRSPRRSGPVRSDICCQLCNVSVARLHRINMVFTRAGENEPEVFTNGELLQIVVQTVGVLKKRG